MALPDFDVIFAQAPEDHRAVQRLRYDVFVAELGGDGPLVDHKNRLEQDQFDAHSAHLMLLDRTRGAHVAQQIVGAYRLLDSAGAARAGGFYSEREFDLKPLVAKPLSLLELGRSCLHREYRGGTAMYHLWSALARYVFAQKVDILFGVASFHGCDVQGLDAPLRTLHERHLAPERLRPIARAPFVLPSARTQDPLDRKAAMTQIPSLIKAYLRLGGYIGQGAYLDHAFNTTDVCLVLDVAQISEKQRKLYLKERG